MAAHPPEAKETGKKWFYKISFLVFAVLVVALTWRQYSNDENEKSAAFLVSSNQIAGLTITSSNQIANLTDQLSQERSENEKAMASLITDFSTNQNINPVVRAAVLSNELEKQNQNEIVTLHAISEPKPKSLAQLRQDRQNLATLDRIRGEEQLIQQQLDYLKNQEIAEQQAEVQKAGEQKSEALAVQRKKQLNSAIIPIFNYAITDLYQTLKGLSSNMPASDFPADPPTIYNSNLQREGIIMGGQNHINLGTNTDWGFTILTDTSAQDSAGLPLKIVFQPKLIIECKSGFLTIQPSHPVEIFYAMDGQAANVGPDLYYLSIKLSSETNAVLNIDQSVPYNDPACLTNIDYAITHLIESQDQASPL